MGGGEDPKQKKEGFLKQFSPSTSTDVDNDGFYINGLVEVGLCKGLQEHVRPWSPCLS